MKATLAKLGIAAGMLFVLLPVLPGSGTFAQAGALEPGFNLDLSEYDFGEVEVGQESAIVLISAYSVDFAKIEMERVGFADPEEADFQITSDRCSQDQPSWNFCDVEVKMNTSLPGPKSAVLVFDGSGETPGQRSVRLDGYVAAEPEPPKLLKASMKVEVPKNVRIGKRFTVRTQITNTGNTELRNLRLASGEDEFGFVHAFSFRHQNLKVGVLAVGETIRRSLLLRVTRKAYPGRFKFYIYLNAPQKTLAFKTRRTFIRR